MVLIPNAPRLGDIPKGEPVPEGVYHLRCDKATLQIVKEGKKSAGAAMANCELTIFGPQDQEQYHGRKIFENFMLAGDGMFRVRQFLEGAGKDEDFVLEDTDALISLEVGAVIGVDAERKDPTTGQVYSARNRVKKFLPIV